MDDGVIVPDETNLTEGDEGIKDNKDPGYMAAVKADLREQYGDELRQYENINPIIKDYFELKAKSADGIFKPKEDATEEEVAKYKETMGIPKDAEGYDLGEVPKELGDRKDFNVWFKDMAIKTDLTKDQAKAVYDQWNTVELEAIKARQLEVKETDKKLREELGSGYDEAVANVGTILQQAGQDFVEYLDETGIGNDPRFIKAMAKLGSVVSEDSIGKTQAGQKGTPLSLAERMYPSQGK